MLDLHSSLSPFFNRLVSTLERAFLHLTQPSRHSIALSTSTHLPQSKFQLVAEDTLLRQQLITLRVNRQVKKPHLTQSERLWLVLLASRVQHWQDALLIRQPHTFLRWHLHGFHLFWKVKTRNHGGSPKLSTETVALIQLMVHFASQLRDSDRTIHSTAEQASLGFQTIKELSEWKSQLVIGATLIGLFLLLIIRVPIAGALLFSTPRPPLLETSFDKLNIAWSSRTQYRSGRLFRFGTDRQ